MTMRRRTRATSRARTVCVMHMLAVREEAADTEKREKVPLGLGTFCASVECVLC